MRLKFILYTKKSKVEPLISDTYETGPWSTQIKWDIRNNKNILLECTNFYISKKSNVWDKNGDEVNAGTSVNIGLDKRRLPLFHHALSGELSAK